MQHENFPKEFLMDHDTILDLEYHARQVRIETLKAIGHLGVGHVGGAMSIIEILTYLYYAEMHVDPSRPRWPDRDRLVLSKGHTGPALYSILALKGFFPKQWLLTLNEGGTNLPSHCDRNKTPGIDMTTGSLGQGLSAAVGIALALRWDKRSSRVYAIIGDGESQEGQIWEAAMSAAHFKLGNLMAFTDFNKMQIDGKIEHIMQIESLEAKWSAFGWHTQRINGHDFSAIEQAVTTAKKVEDKPSMIILDTIKGKGCTFAEGLVESHNMPVSEQQLKEALDALG